MDAVQADILATNIVNIPADCLAKGKNSLTGMLFAVMGKSLQQETYIQNCIYNLRNCKFSVGAESEKHLTHNLQLNSETA